MNISYRYTLIQNRCHLEKQAEKETKIERAKERESIKEIKYSGLVWRTCLNKYRYINCFTIYLSSFFNYQDCVMFEIRNTTYISDQTIIEMYKE